MTVEAKNSSARRAYTIPVQIKQQKFTVLTNQKVILVSGASLPTAQALKLKPSVKVVTTSIATVFDNTFRSRNVAVVVVDVDKEGVRSVHNLHILFPSLKLVAVTNNDATAARARRYGASAIVMRTKATTTVLSGTIGKLLSGR